MSATMQQALVSLLVRKTEEGRAKARQHVEAWQKAIELVWQTGQMAECVINVPPENIEGAQRAAAKIQTVNYVTAVHLTQKATAERNVVIANVTKDLQEEINKRRLTARTAGERLQCAIKECDDVITGAKAKLAAESSRFQSEKSRTQSEVKAFREMLTRVFFKNPKIVFDSLVFGGVAAIISGILQNTIAKDGSAYIAAGWFGIAGWFVVPMLVLIRLRVLIVKARSKERIQMDSAKTAYENAKAISQREVGAAEKRLGEVRSALADSMALAQQKKAEDALKWLQTHV